MTESPNQSRADDLIGTVVAGRYRVEKLLGTGGMGAVYRAEHVHMRKAVALKVLHREMTYLDEVVARFEREAVAASRVEHPNIVGARDFGKLEDGSFYLVLEFVEGTSLEDEIQRVGPFPRERALDVASQMMRALSAAHAAGIVHRDLKPENVMLVDVPGSGEQVKVLDFGIAKITAQDASEQPALTRAGSVFGTPAYMAPEQAMGKPVDARADLYSSALIVYEMLSGVQAFRADDLMAVLTKQITEAPPPLPPGVDPQLAALVMRQLEKEPDDRIQSADEVLAQLEGIASGTPPPVSVGGAASPAPTIDYAEVQPRPAPSSAAAAASGTSDTIMADMRPSLGGSPTSAVQASTIAAPHMPPSSRASIADGALEVGQAAMDALGKEIDVGGQKLPGWALAAGGVGLVLVAFLFVVGIGFAMSGSSDEEAGGGEGDGKSAATKAVDAERLALRKAATEGDSSALSKLARAPNPTSADWLALGKGRAKAGELPAAVAAYANAVDLDAEAARDRQLLADVRQAAEHDRAYGAALELAAKSLGSAGVDIVYDVWSANRSKHSKKSIVKRAGELLDDKEVRGRASPALKVALDLDDARSCAAHKAVLPSAVKHADGRSLRKLRSLSARKGCGFLGLGDCWGCLRGSSDLSDAIRTASKNPAPKLSAD